MPTTANANPSLFGHRQRRALAARTLTRPEWRALCRSVRFERKTPRGERIGRELTSLTGCDIGRFVSRGDMLEYRSVCLSATGTHGRTDPRECNGIACLRVVMAMTWYPTRASKFAPADHHFLAAAR